MGPGAGARGALAGPATVTEDEAEDAAAERITARVTAMMVSRPGRMISGAPQRAHAKLTS